MPIKTKKTEVVQSRVSAAIKLKIAKYSAKHTCTEGEVVRLALDRFLHNTTTK